MPGKKMSAEEITQAIVMRWYARVPEQHDALSTSGIVELERAIEEVLSEEVPELRALAHRPVSKRSKTRKGK